VGRELAPLIALIWLIGRIIYLRSYMADPQKRLLGAGIRGFTNVAMFVVALWGVLRAWLVGRA
jgi:hypothetical protein